MLLDQGLLTQGANAAQASRQPNAPLVNAGYRRWPLGLESGNPKAYRKHYVENFEVSASSPPLVRPKISPLSSFSGSPQRRRRDSGDGSGIWLCSGRRPKSASSTNGDIRTRSGCMDIGAKRAAPPTLPPSRRSRAAPVRPAMTGAQWRRPWRGRSRTGRRPPEPPRRIRRG